MKNAWFAIVIKENEKYYSYAHKIPAGTNALFEWERIPNITIAHLCESRKQAREIVSFWNGCYKRNGSYLFDTIKF